MEVAATRTNAGRHAPTLDVAPVFDWALASSQRGDAPVGFVVEVLAADGPEAGAVHWSSGQVRSRQTRVVYSGPSLGPVRRYSWRVRAHGSATGWGEWSKPAELVTGLLGRPWPAAWIAAPDGLARPVARDLQRQAAGDRDNWLGPPVMTFRQSFSNASMSTRAALGLSALGLVEARLNGVTVDDHRCRPGWTDYRHRVEYEIVDVRHLLRAGTNVIELDLATGWFAGRVAWLEHVYGATPAVSAWLLGDRDEPVFATGAGWVVERSNILWADLVMGAGAEIGRPARRRRVHALVVEAPPRELVAADGPPVRVLERVPPIAEFTRVDGGRIIDFGENLVGTVSLQAPKASSGVLVVRHAEMLDDDGGLYTENLRTARATDLYRIAAGAAPVAIDAPFTVHGFRYCELSGAPSAEVGEIRAVRVGSDCAPTGRFECSNELVNRLVANIARSQRGNFLSVPTDTPARDERLGWLGDAQVFVRSAAWLADVESFLSRWLADVRLGQAGGAFPDVAPMVLSNLFGTGAPGWGDAGVIVPSVLYERYGNREILAASYPSMCAWVDRIAHANPDGVWRSARGNDYGDWLAVGEETPTELIATAYHVRSADLVALAAARLGRTTDQRHYLSIARRARRAFVHRYVTSAGLIAGHTQTGYALALEFGLVPPRLRERAGALLVERVVADRGIGSRLRPLHLTTGFLGVGHLLDALTNTGHVDVAYALLEQTSYPSWLYPVTQGATTIWERWDAWCSDTGFQSRGMNSFNHYALGSVCDWLFTTVGGLRPLRPGFSRISVSPRLGGSLTSASVEYSSVCGSIAVSWQLRDAVEMQLTVPPGVGADVSLPGVAAGSWRIDGRPIEACPDVRLRRNARTGDTHLELTGGAYELQARLESPD